MRLDIKSESILNEFIECCLTLDEKRIINFLKVNPSLIKVNIYESDPITFQDSIKETFNEFILNSPLITVSEKKSVDEKCEDVIKLFNVTYENMPSLNSNFGFLIKIENHTITEIIEYSHTKSYRAKLDKRLFGGLNGQQIMELKEAIKNLPDL